VLKAVIAGRAREESEKQRMRDLWPQLRRRRKDLLPAEVQLLRRVRRGLREFGASHLEILLTENLWADFAAAAASRPLIDVAWAASITYASHRLQGRTIRRAEVAETWGVSAARLGRRFRRIVTTLDLDALDPRYSVDDEAPPAIPQVSPTRPPAPAAAGTRCRSAATIQSRLVPDRKPSSWRARAKAVLARRRMQIARRCSPGATLRAICIGQPSQRWLQPGAVDWGFRSGTDSTLSHSTASGSDGPPLLDRIAGHWGLRFRSFRRLEGVSVLANFFAMVERADPSAPDPSDPVERCWSNVTK
jgi:hypothetical protein